MSANVTTDVTHRLDITDTTQDREIKFSYSVEWVHTPEVKYIDRMKHYSDSTFLPTTFEIHWLSIINSFVLVMLLMAFLTIILMRILKKDFSRYMSRVYDMCIVYVIYVINIEIYTLTVCMYIYIIYKDTHICAVYMHMSYVMLY